jgi:branched-chain amino acid transport system permease protein
VSIDAPPSTTSSEPPPVKPRAKLKVTWVDSFLWAIRIIAVLVIVLGLIGSIMNFIAGEGPTAAAWRDLIVASLSFGAMYGLIALGYSMVYGVLGFINFAHGEVFMSGMFIGYFAATYLAGQGMYQSNPFLALFLALMVSVLTSTIVAVLVERVAYRKLRNSPRLIPLITSIGVSFFLQYSFLGLFGERVRTYPQLPATLTGQVRILGVPIRTVNLLVIVIAAIAMVLLWNFVTKTKTGRAMRAVAEDKEIAALMGINVDRTIVTTFAVGGSMAGVAGMLYGQLFGVSAFQGFIPGIKAFTSAVLGGIGSIPGAMFGGVLLGLFEGVGPLLILDGLGISSPSQLRDVVAFSALVLMLVFRPSGLFGERLGSEDRA